MRLLFWATAEPFLSASCLGTIHFYIFFTTFPLLFFSAKKNISTASLIVTKYALKLRTSDI